MIDFTRSIAITCTNTIPKIAKYTHLVLQPFPLIIQPTKVYQNHSSKSSCGNEMRIQFCTEQSSRILGMQDQAIIFRHLTGSCLARAIWTQIIVVNLVWKGRVCLIVCNSWKQWSCQGRATKSPPPFQLASFWAVLTLLRVLSGWARIDRTFVW